MAFGRRNKLAEQAVEAKTAAKLHQQELAWLKKQMEKQQAVTEALWRLLREKLSLGEEALADEVTKVLASRRSRPKVADLCTSCGRTLQEGRTACFYCGHAVPRREVF